MTYWQPFADFCRLDRLAGGPDSHMATIVHLAKDLPPEERAWWGCVYVAVYNVPQALAILKEFPTRDALHGLPEWVAEHWPHIVLRRERRRPVGSPKKLTACLQSAAAWIDVERMAATHSYDETWAHSDKIKYFGRYAKIKVNEVHRRLGLVPHLISDLRAKDGWSPREGLALLWPEHEAVLNSTDKASIPHVERLATLTQKMLAADYDVVLDNYELQVFACDVKQSIVGQRQYPGRSCDSEITHHAKVAAHFPVHDAMFSVRETLFPLWALGEKQGWTGVREELGECFAKHGYMWTDSVFDYHKTTDLAQPVRR